MEDFPLLDREHSNPISTEIMQTPFKTPKMTLTTLNNNSSCWQIVATTNQLEREAASAHSPIPPVGEEGPGRKARGLREEEEDLFCYNIPRY
jgi:hypothetical protein